mmetsp:Transcript_17864/g.39181  ORF Transcript_17864/g.39181 Transcript_17864/m.39181 type:complete len:130 (-) Transcript_17864:58-447(-)
MDPGRRMISCVSCISHPVCLGRARDSEEIITVSSSQRADEEVFVPGSDVEISPLKAKELDFALASTEKQSLGQAGCPRGISIASTSATDMAELRPAPAMRQAPARGGPIRPGGLAYDYDDDSPNACVVQ